MTQVMPRTGYKTAQWKAIFGLGHRVVVLPCLVIIFLGVGQNDPVQVEGRLWQGSG